MPTPSYLDMLRLTLAGFQKDKCSQLGAAMAFYVMLSLSPMLLMVVGIAGLLYGTNTAREEIVDQFQSVVGNESASTVELFLKSSQSTTGGLLSTVIGLVVLFVGSTSLFTQLQSALNFVWNVPEPETSGLGLWSMVKSRLIAFLLVFGMTVLLLVSLVIGSSSKFIQDWVENQLGTSLAIVQLMNFIMSVVLATLLFAMIYKILPNAYVNWRSVWIGAFTTSVLFNFGKFLIGLYLGHAAVGSSFGAAGSLVAFLVWVYYSAQLLLLGAEFTQVHAQQRSNGFRYR